jgi:electron transfer flavoprotein beta subunit
MGAKKKPSEVVSLGDLGAEPDRVGESGSRTEVYDVGQPPARGDSRKIEDDGNAAQAILDFLAEKRLV